MKKKTPVAAPFASALPVLDFAALTGKDITAFREAVGLSLFRFAARLGVTLGTVRRWEEEPGTLRLHAGSLKKLRALYTKCRRKR